MILEEDEEEVDEMDEEMEVEEVENFGPELVLSSDVEVGTPYPNTEPVSPTSPLPPDNQLGSGSAKIDGGGMPLTADALAKMEAQEGKKSPTVEEQVMS